MPDILKPLTFDDLPTKPPLVGRPRISEDLQQTVALLVGWDETTRRLVNISPTGVLYVASPRVKGILNALSVGTDYELQGDDISVSEVLVRAHPDNTSRIWINIGDTADDNKGYPLDANDWVSFSINNLHTLHFFSALPAQRAILIYTK